MAGQRRSHDRGATLVEFALILPVFLMLLFGMITAGLALNEKQQITHATREGARYAATVPGAQSFTSGTWAENVRELLVERSTGTLVAADVCISLVEGSAPATVIAPTSDFTTNGDGTACLQSQTFPVTASDPGLRVQVTASSEATIDLVLFGAYDVGLDAHATVRSESSS